LASLDLKKKFILVLGFSVGDVTMGACFHHFSQLYLAISANGMSHFWLKLFWKLGFNRFWRALMGFLAYPEA